VDGNILYIDSRIYDFTGTIIWDEDDDAQFSESNRIPYVGAPDVCLENEDPDKPTPVRCIEFVNGGVDIICADSIDARGDVNLNGVANEITDAVVLTNYFIMGLSAFTVNVEGQTAASDVNADGIPLTVADLSYLIRIVVGDALPIPKPNPDLKYSASFEIKENILSITGTQRAIGALSIVLEGEANPALTEDASHMQMDYRYDGTVTRIVICDLNNGLSLEKGSVLILNGSNDVKSIDAGTYDGYIMSTKVSALPKSFALLQNYPNPFNPGTIMEFDLPIACEWKLEIFNILGNKVTEWNNYGEAGRVTVNWDASHYASGVYFYRLTAGDFTMTRRMVLLK
jgi:hypothetical protein